MKISREAKKTSRSLLRLSMKDGLVDEQRAAAVVKSLVADQPRHSMQILKNYQRLLRLEINKQQALVESAAQLSDAEQKQVTEVLRTRHGKHLNPEFGVRPELLGGLRIQVGSNVWDGSVANRLNRLSQKL